MLGVIAGQSGAVPVAGEQLKRARQRAGLTQQELAEKAGTSRQAISGLEKRAYIEDARNLGKVFDVLGLDPDGRPRDTARLVDADLRSMPVPDLIALQGRLTAEFARRLSRPSERRLTGDPLIDYPGGSVFTADDMPDVDVTIGHDKIRDDRANG